MSQAPNLPTMTREELEQRRQALIAQQASLAAELSALHDEERALIQADEARKREEVRSVALVIEVTEIARGHVYLKTEYNDAFVEIMRQVRGRVWDSVAKQNILPVESWDNAQRLIAEQLPNATLKYTNGTQEELQSELSKPDYEVTLSPDGKWLNVKVGRADSLIIKRIPGSDLDYKTEIWKIPVSEGWRLYDALATKDKVLWADSALALIQSDIEKRQKLDEIALKEDSAIEVSFTDENAKMRPFQKVTVEFVEATGGHALIAHQMGLGKTWCALGYSKYKKLRTLVICPASLKTNWAREIHRLTGELPLIHTGKMPDAWDLKKMLSPERAQYHIINYDILGARIETADELPSESDPNVILKRNVRERWLWVELINASKFDLIVLDESHYIKNNDALRSKAARKLVANQIIAMTGTPVLNRPGELWPILTLLAPEKFPSFETFIRQYTFNNREARNVDELRELLKSIMIRKLKKDVVKELPPVNRIYEWTTLSDGARSLYNKVLQGVYLTLKEWSPGSAGEEQAVMSVLAEIMRLRQVVSVDKIEFTSDLAVEINDSIEVRNGTRDPVHKVIVFTTFVPVAHGIANRLGNEALCLTGELNTQQRQVIVDQFKSDAGKRFLVATDKVASEGLNLQEAYAVVFHDFLWTPAGHEQCEGRAYGRLADAHGIDSYWVACEDTIDQMMQEILSRKMSVINSVVEGIDSERGASIVKELLARLKEKM